LHASSIGALFFATMKMLRLFFVACGLSGLLIANLHATEPKAPPAAEKKPVFNEYHGTKVEDDYQWLENDDDPAVKAWSDAENQRTRAYLDRLPSHAEIEKQLQEWYAKTSPSYSSIVPRPGVLFAMKFQPPKQQPTI
jgi:prolyl oligopeptidase